MTTAIVGDGSGVGKAHRVHTLLRAHGPLALSFAPLAILLGGFFVAPLLGVIWNSFDGFAFDFGSYARVFGDEIYLDVLRRTFRTGLVVTVACVALGYPVAYLLTVLGRRAATVLATFVLVPLFTAFLIRTYAWMIILGRKGIINDFLLWIGLTHEPVLLLHTSLAVYIGMTHVLMPIAIFTMYAVMVQIDRNLAQAAQVLGANPVRGFLRVYFPMSLPGVMAAAILIFIMSLGFYITPALLGGPGDLMISQLIVAQTNALLNFQMGFALAVVLLVSTLLVLFFASLFIPLETMWGVQMHDSGRILRDDGWRSSLQRLLRAIGQPVRLTLERTLFAVLLPLLPRWRALMVAYGIVVVLFFMAPLIVIVILSFSSSPFLIFPPPGLSWRWYEKFLAARDWHQAFLFSIQLGLTASAIAVAIGTAGAFAIVRSALPCKRSLFLLSLSPIVMPAIILSLAFYTYFANIGILGTFPGLVLGHVVLATPYVIVVMSSAVRGLDRNLEHAGAVLGASPGQVLTRITLPLLRPALVTGGLLAFLMSFDELLVSIFLLGRQAKTLPIKFWADIKYQMDPLLSTASTIIVFLVATVIISGQILRLRRERHRTLPPTAMGDNVP